VLTPEENELLTRVGRGTPMGTMMRRYWIPACLSSELPEPDCDPVRVRLLGEDLVAFRDSDGRVGLLGERCPHRGASLFYGRNEDGGLRCLYHGWNFDVSGRVLDTPCEPPGSTFKDRLRHTAYRVHEQGDMVWAYMGPPELEPPFPDFEWTLVPSENREIAKVENDCNYLQGVEGVVDSSHVDILHSGIALMRKETYIPPTYEVEDTPYGFRYGATRMPPFRVIGRDDGGPKDQDGLKYVRTSCFVAPFHTLVPPSNHGHMMIFVPIDDEHNFNYSIYYSTGKAIDRAEMAERRRSAVGPDLHSDGTKVRTMANNYLQDRAAMRAKKHWSGIAANPNQDAAMTESMGFIYDRSEEHLGYSDLAVQHMRRRMLDAVRQFTQGGAPLGLDNPIQHREIRSHAMVIPQDAPWNTVDQYSWETVS
jgi:phthalate 4,5-dioxygenase oxygenase subunit